jgi:tRNA dimethylallyltransferase
MNKLIAIVGPTAVGKSSLALELALKYHGEIINADSRQVYRYMDIGTAKPNAFDQHKIPHHLVDIIYPDEQFSLSLYQNLALSKIKEIDSRGNIPFLVGGSGLYIWTILENWNIPEVPPDSEYRLRLEKRAREEGFASLFKELQQLDPEASLKIMPTNIRRVIRALEIYHTSGKKASSFQQKGHPGFSFLIIGLTMERQQLYNIIDKRVDDMIEAGLVEEVKDLESKGYSPDLSSMSGIGYKQICLYLRNAISLDTAVSQIKTDTHRFARKQYAWFHLNDNRINWFDVNDNIKDNIDKLIERFLKEER